MFVFIEPFLRFIKLFEIGSLSLEPVVREVKFVAPYLNFEVKVKITICNHHVHVQ